MTELSELAAVMMRGAQNRVDVTASNVANLNTPSYRAHRLFSRILDDRYAMPVDVQGLTVNTSAALKTTGNPLDVATDPSAVMLVRSDSNLEGVRSAQLRADADGRLVDALGRAIQAEGGGDVAIGSGKPSILQDGTITVGGQAVAKIGLFKSSPDDRAGLGAMAPAEGAKLHTGMVAASDVDLGSEMVELTRASRLAETGAKIFSVYDDLLGATATKLGELPK